MRRDVPETTRRAQKAATPKSPRAKNGCVHCRSIRAGPMGYRRVLRAMPAQTSPGLLSRMCAAQIHVCEGMKDGGRISGAGQHGRGWSVRG